MGRVTYLYSIRLAMRSLATNLLFVMLITFQGCAASGDWNKRIIRESAPQLELLLLRTVNRDLEGLKVNDDFKDVRAAIDVILKSKEWTLENMKEVLEKFKEGLDTNKHPDADDAAGAESALRSLCHAFAYKKGCDVAYMDGDIRNYVVGAPEKFKRLANVTDWLIKDLSYKL